MDNPSIVQFNQNGGSSSGGRGDGRRKCQALAECAHDLNKRSTSSLTFDASAHRTGSEKDRRLSSRNIPCLDTTIRPGGRPLPLPVAEPGMGCAMLLPEATSPTVSRVLRYTPSTAGEITIQVRMSGSPPGNSALRVLVVDDDPNIRMTLSMCLEGDGHDVVACGSIDEALAEASRRVFDLVFLDIRLGVQNGLDFIPQLLSQSPWATGRRDHSVCFNRNRHPRDEAGGGGLSALQTVYARSRCRRSLCRVAERRLAGVEDSIIAGGSWE